MELKLLSFIKSNLTSDKYSRTRFFSLRDKYRTWKYSFEEIYITSMRFCRYLQKNGIKADDKILLKGVNGPEWIISFLGILFCGAVVVPLDLKSTADFDIKINKKVNARAIIAEDEQLAGHFKDDGILKFYFSKVTDLSGKYPVSNNSGLKKIPNFTNSSKDKNIKDSFEYGYEYKHKDEYEGGNKYENENDPVQQDSNRLAEIIFTSGTTSEPKGVMITCKNIEASLKSIIIVMQKYDRIFNLMVNPLILSVVPLSHMYGQLIGIFTPLITKSSVIFTRSINPQHILKIIKKQKVWILGVLPKILDMIKEHLTGIFNLKSQKFLKKYNRLKFKRWQIRLLRFLDLHIKIGWRLVAIMVGGAVLDPSVEEFFRTLSYSIFQGYGLTETSPLITLSDPLGSVAGSIGRVLPGQEVKIIDSEVYVRGENVSSGYYMDAEKTRKSFTDGWFKTGDLAEADSSGHLFFKGRRDDLIVRPDGLNIYPGDIEKIIRSIDFVRDCAVLEIRQKDIFKLVAVIIPKSDSEIEPSEIVELANKSLNIYQKLSGCFIWPREDFPRTPTMKVKKGELADFILKSGFMNKEQVLPESENGISAIINKFHKIDFKKIKTSSRLESDVGLDSIEIIELADEIEKKYNIEIDDSLISRETTLKELESMIKNPSEAEGKIPFYGYACGLPSRIIRTVFQYILYPFISMLYRKKVKGRENLKNLKLSGTPVVFAANHTSSLDAFLILYALPLKIRQHMAVIMSIEHHFSNFFYKKGLKIRQFVEGLGFYMFINLFINAIPLSRTYGFKKTLENAGTLADMGFSLLIFPEGGVTTDGKIKNFEKGIGIIASDMRMPVVPVKIEGLYNILRNGILPWKHLPRIPRVKITFGQILVYNNKNYYQITNDLEEIIKNRL